MGNGFRIVLFLLLLTGAGGAASAAPSAGAAFDEYRAALGRRGLDAGRQGVLFETLAGKQLLAHNAEGLFNPASVVKLATADAALRRLGPDFRYETRFLADGPIDRTTGELRGDLVVIGSGDPSFVTEHAFAIADALRDRGVARIAGNVAVYGPFSANFSGDPLAAGRTLTIAFERSRWDESVRRAYRRARPGRDPREFRDVAVDGGVVVRPTASTDGLTPLFAHRSAPLLSILKELNNYSNNWMAHSVGARLGGAGGVERSLVDRYAFRPADVRLETTSGLGENEMRPRDIVKLLREISTSLGDGGPARLMPVAGVDPGTLATRFRDAHLRGAVVAKTGTLNSVSVLAGYMYTRSYGTVLFAIANEGGSPGSFRPLQDLLVREMFGALGGPAPRPYAAPAWRDALAGSIVDGVEATARARPSGRVGAAARARAAARPWLARLPRRPAHARWPEWIRPELFFAPEQRPLLFGERRPLG